MPNAIRKHERTSLRLEHCPAEHHDIDYKVCLRALQLEERGLVNILSEASCEVCKSPAALRSGSCKETEYGSAPCQGIDYKEHRILARRKSRIVKGRCGSSPSSVV